MTPSSVLRVTRVRHVLIGVVVWGSFYTSVDVCVAAVICTIESLAECCAVSGRVFEGLRKDFDSKVLAEHQREIVAHLFMAVANVIVIDLQSTYNTYMTYNS